MASLAPARTKYRKMQKGSNAGNAKRGNTLAFGEFGLRPTATVWSCTKATSRRSCS